MNCRSFHSLPIYVLMLSLAAAAVSPALAQTGQADRTCEQQLEDAKRQLQQAEQRIRELQAQNDELRKKMAKPGSTPGAGSPGGGKPGDTPAPAAGPYASPDALRQAMIRDFEAELGSQPRNTPIERGKFQSAAKAWIREAPRDFRGPIDWRISVIKVDAVPSTASRGANLTFQVLDAEGKPIGGQVTQLVPARFVKMLSESVAPKQHRLVGTVTAKPTFSAERVDKGADESTFIGPYTEFAFDLVVNEVTEVK